MTKVVRFPFSVGDLDLGEVEQLIEHGSSCSAKDLFDHISRESVFLHAAALEIRSQQSSSKDELLAWDMENLDNVLDWLDGVPAVEIILRASQLLFLVSEIMSEFRNGGGRL